MAFCKQCGTDLKAANFCPNCGCSNDGNPGANTGMDMRARSLNEMENMLRHFTQKQSTYDEFDVVLSEVTERSNRTYSGWIIAAVISLLIGFFNGAAFFYIIGAAFITISVLLGKKNKEKLAVVKERLDALATELEQHYTDYGYCPIGLEYVRPSILRELYELIRKGRASNPADAINIYLADLQQEEMLILQREATRAARETEKASKRTASYSTASFWLKD